jgi:hypothetical protein
MEQVRTAAVRLRLRRTQIQWGWRLLNFERGGKNKHDNCKAQETLNCVLGREGGIHIWVMYVWRSENDSS